MYRSYLLETDHQALTQDRSLKFPGGSSAGGTVDSRPRRGRSLNFPSDTAGAVQGGCNTTIVYVGLKRVKFPPRIDSYLHWLATVPQNVVVILAGMIHLSE